MTSPLTPSPSAPGRPIAAEEWPDSYTSEPPYHPAPPAPGRAPAPAGYPAPPADPTGSWAVTAPTPTVAVAVAEAHTGRALAPAPAATPPYGTAPDGAPAYGTTPFGPTPYGTTPYGSAPYGTAPAGLAPDGTVAAPSAAWAPAHAPVGRPAPPAPPMRPPAAPPWAGAPASPAPGRRANRGPSIWIAVAAVVLAVAVITSLLIGTTFTSTTATAPRPPVASAPAPSSDPGAASPAPTSPSTTAPSTSSPATPSLPEPGSGNPAGGSSGAPSWDDVEARIDPGVVNIESRLAAGVGAGTGIVLTADGEILTNNHVVDGASRISVTIATTGDTYQATLVGADKAHDIAVLRLRNASGLTTIPIGDSDTVAVGDDIVAIGNAGGRGGDPAFETGSVVALHRQITASDEDGTHAETLRDLIQVDATVVPGNSGGPLADVNGTVIGINTAAGQSRYRTAAKEGYAIPINTALSIAEEIEAAGPSSASPTDPGSPDPSSSDPGSAADRGYLGVVAQDASAGGAQITAVQSASPAQKAGLRAGDVITTIDGTAVSDADELTAALQGHRVGDRVTVSWETSTGRDRQASITLVAR